MRFKSGKPPIGLGMPIPVGERLPGWLSAVQAALFVPVILGVPGAILLTQYLAG